MLASVQGKNKRRAVSATEEGNIGRCLSMCKVDTFDLLEEGRISATGKALIGEQNCSAKGSWGNFPGEVPLKVRRLHVSREGSTWAEGYGRQRPIQSHGIANTCVWIWDGPGDFRESSFQEVTRSANRPLGTERQMNCIEIKGSGVDDSPSKSEREREWGMRVPTGQVFLGPQKEPVENTVKMGDREQGAVGSWGS